MIIIITNNIKLTKPKTNKRKTFLYDFYENQIKKNKKKNKKNKKKQKNK